MIERKQALQTYAEQASDRDWPEVERRFREIAGTFQSIVADSPDAIEARLIYGKFLDFFGDHEGARDQFVEVLHRDPTVAVAHQQLGTYFAETGDFGRAFAYYLAAVEHEPEEPVYHFGLGELMLTHRVEMVEEVGLTPEVLEREMLRAFRTAHELDPQDPVFAFRYGEVLVGVTHPDWEAARSHWQAFAAQPGLSGSQLGIIRLHEARSLGELGRYDEARALVESVDDPEWSSLREALLEAIDEAESGS